MKELSIEERAQRYDEAIDRAKKWYNAPNIDKIPTYGNRIIEGIFPELNESEGKEEKIRGKLIHLVKKSYEQGGYALHKWDADEMLAWLEKQKPSEEAIQYLKENHSPSEVSDFQTAMNIAVAKAYDKGVKDGLENRGQTFTKKEVDDAYLAGVRDAKKELKKISQRMISAEAKEAMYGKPTTWSEEDEKMRKKALLVISDDCGVSDYEEISDWLKSLKQRIGG